MPGIPPQQLYPRPFVDDLYLREVEERVKHAEEHNAIVEMEGGHVPQEMHELISGDFPVLIAELRRRGVW